MNAFRIYQDQENEAASRKAGTSKPIKLATDASAQPSKRAVLGLINENNKSKVQNGKPLKQGLKVSNGENAGKKLPENCKAAKQIKSFKIHEDVTIKEEPAAETKASLPVAIKKDNIKNEDKEEVSSVSADISNLHIPDSNDGYFMDMSMDSICGSPMSVDKSVIAKRQEHQLTLDKFFNVLDYEQEIYVYMKECEVKFRPKPGYMRKQHDISYSMRSILVDWLVEVADEYNLQTETLFLAVSYIDRFLSYMSVVRGKLQLVGTASMFIASKFEEIYPPDVGEFVYITDDTYSKKQVLRMEHLILKVLGFCMSSPTIIRFATKYCMSSDCPLVVKHLTQYLCELTMLDGENFLQFLPSEIGAAATALARHTLEMDPWPKTLEEIAGHSLEDLYPCLTVLTSFFANASQFPQQSVFDKFSTSKWSHVSQLKPRKPYIVPNMEITPASSNATSKPE